MMYSPENNQFLNIAQNWFESLNSLAKTKYPDKYLTFFGEYSPFRHGDTEMEHFKIVSEALKNEYKAIKSNIEDLDNDKWYLLIRDYIYFLSMCEKGFMYNANTEIGYEVSYKIDKSFDRYTLSVDGGEANITYSFQDSSINLPGIDINAVQDDEDPLGFIKEDMPKKDIDTVLFIEVNIKRETGSSNQFKFIYSSEVPYIDKWDKISLDVAKELTKRFIINNFKNILVNVIFQKSRLATTEWNNELFLSYMKGIFDD